MEKQSPQLHVNANSFGQNKSQTRLLQNRVPETDRTIAQAKLDQKNSEAAKEFATDKAVADAKAGLAP